MGKGKTKDRTGRWAQIEHLLYQNSKGLKIKEIARVCNVSTRQIYRDLGDLESKLGIPIWEQGSIRGIVEDYFLPPIRFSLPEAMTIFLASRLLLAYTNVYNPSIETTFTKLNSIVPGPLRDQISKTIEWMQRQRKDERFLHILESLAQAWMNGHRVKIRYWTLGDESPKERIIEPYFIQPAALEHANYVIAYCHHRHSIRTFKIERIESVELLDEQYTVPANFDANDYLGSSWGITVDSEGEVIKQETIKLKFNPEIARIAEETTWHPSQITQRQLDGSAIVTMNLSITVELLSFILGWGEKVEVLEPEELREEISKTAREMLNVYKRK